MQGADGYRMVRELADGRSSAWDEQLAGVPG